MYRALLSALALLLTPAAAAQDPGPAPVDYHPPSATLVVEAFRPPASDYGPGHRGLAYSTGPDAPVRAAAAGTVTFAGRVAGSLHITVLHADRVRTTYAFLAGIAVGEGDAVAAGEVVGTSSGRFLWTARLGRAYLDPAVLLQASGHRRVHLVPDGGTSAGRDRPRSRPVTAAAAGWALEGAR